MNDITKFLNIEDDGLIVVDSYTEEDTKFVVLKKKHSSTYCPNCKSIMHSKGFYQRHINHSMLMDGFKLVINLMERKWRCTNPKCNTYLNDEFSFVLPYKRNTNLLPILIINALKDTNRTLVDVANMFNVSDTYVREVFMSYIDMKRLPLPEVLSIDEVFLDIDYKTKFACVLMDFKTKEIVDILPNRWKTTLDSYFLSIPIEERNNVKFIISDMYDVYVHLNEAYFHNAVTIIDSFHVISNLENKLIVYINSVKRRYQERDDKELEEKNRKNNTNYKSSKKSKEVNVLSNYSYFLLKDKYSIEYYPATKYNKHVHYYASTAQLEDEFMKLDPQFPVLRELKQRYVDFNRKKFETPEETEEEYNKIINEYIDSDNAIFIEFARLLDRYRIPILASFKYYELNEDESVRLSQGRMEGFNRTPKDMKRDARGFEVFEYIRNRLIFASRKNAPIKGIPKEKSEIPRSNKKHRKNRKKNNK